LSKFQKHGQAVPGRRRVGARTVGDGMTAEPGLEWDPVTRYIRTSRLLLRPWRISDVAAAWRAYGAPEVARWLCPALPSITNELEAQALLTAWIGESDATDMPLGRWAITDRASSDVIGGVALLPLPPERTDLEIGWQVCPELWGRGYGSEAGHAVAHQAFDNDGVTELFAVMRPGNIRGVATARRIGMDWVGETNKYYGLTLQVYRLTKADLDLPEPACARAP
jgi:RimJ/RimL family protein N-acetyltransferase